jgi:hypothetical protein
MLKVAQQQMMRRELFAEAVRQKSIGALQLGKGKGRQQQYQHKEKVSYHFSNSFFRMKAL